MADFLSEKFLGRPQRWDNFAPRTGLAPGYYLIADSFSVVAMKSSNLHPSADASYKPIECCSPVFDRTDQALQFGRSRSS